MIRSATKLVFSICLGSIGLFVSAQIAVAQEEPSKSDLSLQPNVAIATPLDEATLLQKSSFIIGYNMTSQWLNELKQQGVDCDTTSLKEGIRKAVEGEDFGMTDEEVKTVMLAFQKVVEKKLIENMKAAAELNRTEGEAYLAPERQKRGCQAAGKWSPIRSASRWFRRDTEGSRQGSDSLPWLVARRSGVSIQL